jgi:hypothetical protein
MKRVSLSLIIIAVITAFTACVETQPSGELPYIWGVDTVQEGDPRVNYLTAEYILSQPSMDRRNFDFVFTSKTPITSKLISISFSQDGKEYPFVIEDLNIVNKWGYLSKDLTGNNVKTEVPDFRYHIWCQLTAYDITRVIDIDTVTLNFDGGYIRNFPVALTFIPMSIDYLSHPAIFMVSQEFFSRDTNDVFAQYSLFTGTLIVGRHAAVVDSFSMRSLPIMPKYMILTRIYDASGQRVNEESQPLIEGFILEAYCQYEIAYAVDHTQFQGFYDEAIDVQVTIDGVYKNTWYSNVNQISSGMPIVVLSDASLRFFE